MIVSLGEKKMPKIYKDYEYDLALKKAKKISHIWDIPNHEGEYMVLTPLQHWMFSYIHIGNGITFFYDIKPNRIEFGIGEFAKIVIWDSRNNRVETSTNSTRYTKELLDVYMYVLAKLEGDCICSQMTKLFEQES